MPTGPVALPGRDPSEREDERIEIKGPTSTLRGTPVLRMVGLRSLKKIVVAR